MARNYEKDGRKQNREIHIEQSDLSSFSSSLSLLSFTLQVKEIRSMREREREKEREREREREREKEREREIKWNGLFALRSCIVFPVEA